MASLYERTLLVLRSFAGFHKTIASAVHVTIESLTIVFVCDPSEQILAGSYAMTSKLKPDLDVSVTFRHITGEIKGHWEAVCLAQGDEALKENFFVQSNMTPIIMVLARDHDDAVDNVERLNVEKYKVTCVGGTFDHLHPGHKILLSVTALMAQKTVIIGLSSDEMLTNKEYRELLESYDTRAQRVRDFIALINPQVDVEIVPLRDLYGPTVEREDIALLIVSKETEDGAQKVNEKRAERNMKKLDVYVVECMNESETLVKISSTTIRKRLFEKKSKKEESS